MIGRSLSQRWADREAQRSIVVVARCTVCGQTSTGGVERGACARMTVDHDPSCAFLQAIERDEGHAYVSEHGYPVIFETITAAGAA